jgi:hypothetical protein
MFGLLKHTRMMEDKWELKFEWALPPKGILSENIKIGAETSLIWGNG